MAFKIKLHQLNLTPTFQKINTRRQRHKNHPLKLDENFNEAK